MKKILLLTALLTQAFNFAQDLDNSVLGEPTEAAVFTTTPTDWTSQPFITGSRDRAGINYSIEFGRGPIAGYQRGFIVDLYDDNLGVPGDFIVNLNGKSNFTNAKGVVNTYTNPTVILTADTKYHIVMRSTNGPFSPAANRQTLPIASQNGFSSSRIVTSNNGGSSWLEHTSRSPYSNFVFSLTTIMPAPINVIIRDASRRTTEGNRLFFQVELDRVSTEIITVNVKPRGGTADSDDLFSEEITLTFNPGKTFGSVQIGTRDDDQPEVDETVVLEVVSFTGNLNDTSDTGVGIIEGNDLLPPMISNFDEIMAFNRNLKFSEKIDINTRKSQPFVTGNKSINTLYFMTVLSDIDDPTFSKGFVAELYDDNAGEPGTLIKKFDGRSSFADNFPLGGSNSGFNRAVGASEIFEADDLTLTDNTKYHIVVSSTQDEFFLLETTGADATVTNGFAYEQGLVSEDGGAWEAGNRFVSEISVIEASTLSINPLETEKAITNFSNGIFSVENKNVSFISVYNLSGKKVATTTNNYIGFSFLSKGIYIIEIDINGSKTIVKFLNN